jgi:hypothetical protein
MSANIHEGMEVYGSDNHMVGPIVKVTSDHFSQILHIEGGYTVPSTAVHHVEEDRVYLPNPADMYLSQLRAHDDDYQRELAGFQQHFADRQATTGGDRTFEEAEPNYQMGYTAGSDQRYTGRTFEDVEPELRRTYETRTSDDNAAWEHLRDEIRAGWDRARGQ